MRKLFTKDNIMKTIVAVLIIIWMGLLTLISFTNPVIKTIEVPVPCEHVSLEDVNVIEQSTIYLDKDKRYPVQRVLYNQVTNTTYIYTYFWEDRFNNNGVPYKYLSRTEILQINSDGTTELIK